MLLVACWTMVAAAAIAGDDDDKAVNANRQAAHPGLTGEQQRAVGVIVAHPQPAKAPERIEALGLVLDAAALIADSGESTAAVAAEHSASAELARLRALREGGAGASLKMIDAAQADQARAQAQAQAAEARFASRWGPMATLPASARQKLIEASARGGSVLLRAELPGRHTVGVLPARAVVDVDGIEVPGRVLGLLRESSEQQGVGLLIEVPNAPAGLGPGARIPVALLTADRQGLLLPRDALLYDDRGAYVYKQLTKKSDADKALYAAVRVNLLLPLGDGWLVEGVDDDDNIVVHGAGVLWSLQGVGAQQHDDDDDD
ncbi:MAG TPA: hypothetical protein VNH21_08215 [Steroidobacteraceae bacterium]|nr:hypothetical protein [Steroidobacteraceae bacterium]